MKMEEALAILERINQGSGDNQAYLRLHDAIRERKIEYPIDELEDAKIPYRDKSATSSSMNVGDFLVKFPSVRFRSEDRQTVAAMLSSYSDDALRKAVDALGSKHDVDIRMLIQYMAADDAKKNDLLCERRIRIALKLCGLMPYTTRDDVMIWYKQITSRAKVEGTDGCCDFLRWLWRRKSGLSTAANYIKDVEPFMDAYRQEMNSR